MNRLLLGAALLSSCTRLTPQVTTVNGARVELVTAGPDTHAVVFEAGLGSDWSVWDEAAAQVARSARVFAYSRPGYGQSGPATTPRDPLHIVEELRALLTAQGLAPPYVLVGHSFGGTYMELFAKAHPNEVRAVVLVEPRHRDFTRECEAEGLAGCTMSASFVKTLPRVQQEELTGFALASEQLRSAGDFGGVPVRVLTATSHGESEAWERLWRSTHSALAAEATDGEQRILEGSHNLEVERAGDIARLVVELISQPAR